MKLNEAIQLIFVERGLVTENPVTMKAYAGHVMNFCAYLRNPEVINVRIEDIEAYIRDIRISGLKINAISHKLCAIRLFFKLLRRRGMIAIDPNDIPLPTKEWTEPRVATDDDIEKVLTTIGMSDEPIRVRDRTLILFLRDTGVRLGELRKIKVSTLDLVNKRCTIKTEKSRGLKPFRTVFWYDECHATLLRWLEARKKVVADRDIPDNDFLFIGVSGFESDKPLTKPSIGKMMRDWSRKAGIRLLNPHSLRHRKGVKMALASANNSIISNILGHSSIDSSRVYTQMNDVQLQESAYIYAKEK